MLDTLFIEQLLNGNSLIIGKGATSTIYKVKNCFTGKGSLCLKILNDEFFKLCKSPSTRNSQNEFDWNEEEDSDQEIGKNEEPTLDMDKIRQILMEYEILNNLNHPNIINIFGFYTGDKNHNPAILLEYCRYSLDQAIKKLDDIYLVGIIYEICSAMKYVHENNIIHRDLKMNNILININKHVKICDFGFSKVINMTTLTSMTHGVGTIAFMAPEMFGQGSMYDEKVDVYSFGVVMYFIVTKGIQPNFTGTGCYATLALPESINKLSSSIIKKCWSSSPQERPSFDDILRIIFDNNFMLIDGIESKLPMLRTHLGLE